MNQTSRSIMVFGIYLVITGFSLIIIPNVILPILGLAPTQEVWIRVAGLLTLILGGYFLNSVRTADVAFQCATVYARLVFFTGVTAFVLLGLVSPLLVLFGLIDLAGAAWTWFSSGPLMPVVHEYYRVLHNYLNPNVDFCPINDQVIYDGT